MKPKLVEFLFERPNGQLLSVVIEEQGKLSFFDEADNPLTPTFINGPYFELNENERYFLYWDADLEKQ